MQPAEEKTAQVRVKRPNIVEGNSYGTVFYTTPTKARLFLDMGVVELIGGKVPGPTEQPTAGPTEVKSSDTQTAGHSIASALSSQGGQATPSSASAEVQASPSSSALALDAEQEKELNRIDQMLYGEVKEAEGKAKDKRGTAAAQAREQSAAQAKAEASKRAKERPVSGLSRSTTRISAHRGRK